MTGREPAEDAGAPEETTRAEVTVRGTVQGVGFRPFVYRTASNLGLAGWVRNTGDASVDVVLEGPPEAVDGFVEALRSDPPPLARVDDVDVERTGPAGLEGFEIRDSADDDGGAGTIPPDTGICDDCLADVRDPDSRYHRYWATACVDCGPRYTVVRDLPYDRPRTAMADFPLCADCEAEYEDPLDRRYHAQTMACPACGPTVRLLDSDWAERASGPPAIDATAEQLRDGAIAAVRGVGGTHLVCRATDANAVARLRERTGRPAKPFALMAADLDAVEMFATVTDTEREALTDVRRPIVLLDRTGDEPWLDAVAPGLHTVGVMLPYAGLHHLLFDDVADPLVMTSANLPGEPMATDVADLRADLGDVVDVALVHDRDIVARCDDSVVRVVDADRQFLRRSRGWVPVEVPGPVVGDAPPIVALGPAFDVTVAVTQGDAVVPSQHVGDVDGPDTEAFLRETVEHLESLLGVDPEVVACDRHPDFRTTAIAEEWTGDPVRVQHHHAHAAGLLAEHDLTRAVVVAADGTGYGLDGTIWGGEVLDARLEDFERVAGLAPFRLPGGETAVERPARILPDLLGAEKPVDDLLVARSAATDVDEAAAIRHQATRGVNAPETSSAGRVLDAVAALLGVCDRRRYEGEPAMRLEAAAVGGEPWDLDLAFADQDGRRVLDVRGLVDDLHALAADHSTSDVAATAQDALARGLGQLAVEAAHERDLSVVGFTGGVAYNEAITRRLRATVERSGLQFRTHDVVPPGDGGVAYGQAVVAAARRG